MAIKKSELYSTLWASCNKLRGGMDASQYKDYVLVLLFVKYVSDKYSADPDAQIIIPAGGSFNDMVALKASPDIGKGINTILNTLAEANGLTGIITQADFNDSEKLGKGKEMQDKLSGLISIFENPALDFSRNRADGDDILGDAYEYLMRHFAAESGKSKGQFYTPAEVSRIMASILGIGPHNSGPDTTAYDPTCGSGSLLLKIAHQAAAGIKLFGQEKEVTTAGLARMNMILHNCPAACIAKGQSTLSNPLFLSDEQSLMQFDYAVSNPPFSSKNWTDGFNPYDDPFGRFKDFGVPPLKNGDYAFLLHIIHSLKPEGKGAVILPHGVLFRANAEADIRKALIRKGYIKAIIGLPPNLFYGTAIPACLIVIDKENAAERISVFMIDASGGYSKDGNKNRLREQDIRKIIDVCSNQVSIEKYARSVSIEEIAANDYNLNISRYIDNQPAEDLHDIQAHLVGGIPDSDIRALQPFWNVYAGLKEELFSPHERQGYSILKVPVEQVPALIFSHPQFKAYVQKTQDRFDAWRKQSLPLLEAIAEGMRPADIISALGDSLLLAFSESSLIDNYDLYQHLMTYWNDVMQDDVYDIVAEGWDIARQTETLSRKKETEGRIIPRHIISHVCFAPQQQHILDLEAQRLTLASDIQAMEEEHATEDGMLAEVLSEKGKPVRTLILQRIITLQNQQDSAPLKMAAEAEDGYGEITLLSNLLNLYDREAEISRKIKEEASGLDKIVAAKYAELSIQDIKMLVIEDKWMKKLREDLSAETENISHRLAERVRELAERYEVPLPSLAAHTEDIAQKVAQHLKNMGFEWK